MHLAHGAARLKRALSLVGLFAVLGVGSLTLMQCRMVGDRLTGVEVDQLASKPSSECAEQCREARDAAIEAEETLHEANIAACGRDRDCLRAEFSRHRDQLAAIDEQYKQCVNGCHSQGGGD